MLAAPARLALSRAAMFRRFALPIAILALAALQLVAFRPGIMVWDAIRQYRQALSGHYDDWHPPAMNWLWRQLGIFGSGPAPMLVLQVALYWLGFGLLARAVTRRRGARAGTATLACALLPVPFWLVGTVLKDSLMAGALLVAAGLLAGRRPGDRWKAVVATLLLLAAATLRFNAAAACLPLLVAALPPRWTATRVRLASTAIAALVPLVVAMPLADRLLDADRSGVALSLVIYDLGGIAHFSGADVLPPVPVAAPTRIVGDCWSPVSWDRYAWWTADPCPVGFALLRPAFLASGRSPYRWWAAAVLRYPLAYAEHRLAHANRNLRLWVRDDDLPGLSLASDPNPWGYRVPPSRLRDILAGLATASTATPLGWPACWLALGLGLLVAAPARRGDDIALPLLWSAALYALSYVPLSVASEVRYHVWTMSAVALGAVMMVARPRPAEGIPRWRLAIGAAIPLLATVVAIAARL